MRRGVSTLIVAFGLLSCGSPEEEIGVVFPDALTREETSDLVVTIFEPLREEPGEITAFLRCDEVGTFTPTNPVNPLRLGGPGLGQVFTSRASLGYEEGFASDISLPILTATERNPWGLIMVLVEARGDVVGTSGELDDLEVATLAKGCRCVRTLTGRHPDVELDREVKAACSPLAAAGPSGPRIDLEPVANRAFPLSVCGSDQVNGPIGATMSPGAQACIRPIRCEGVAVPACHTCRDTCNELNFLSDIPIRYDVEGGGVSPRSILTVTGRDGRAEARFDLANCTGDYEITATVLGRRDEQIRFKGSCVTPPAASRCGGEVLLGDAGRVEHLTRVPRGGRGSDVLAVLQRPENGTLLRVIDVNRTRNPIAAELRFPNEEPRGLFGFEYDEGGRALVAAASSLGADEVVIRVFEWDGAELTQTATLAQVCPEWSCGSLRTCAEGCPADEVCLPSLDRCVQPGTNDGGTATCADAPVNCACVLRVGFSAEIAFSTVDLDGDGRQDLAATSSNEIPIAVWLSGDATGGAPYVDGGCRCSQHSKAATDIAFPRLGGSLPEATSSPDVAMAEASGSFVAYGVGFGTETLLQCRPGVRFGEIILARQVEMGSFSCARQSSPGGCPPYDDLIVVSNQRQDGSAFDDPGRIRVVFGGPYSVGDVEDIYDEVDRHTSIEPRETPRRATDPEDVKVADLNGDGHDDFAVLYAAARQVRGWLGRSNRGFGELASEIDLDSCDQSLTAGSSCMPLDALALPDVNGDGQADMVVVCDPMENMARLRWYSSAR